MRNPGSIRSRRVRRGGALLETAIVLPLLLSLSFGLVEFGHYFYVKHCLEGAAREGVRAAIVQGAQNSDVTAAVSRAMAAASLQASGYTVSSNPANVNTAEGTELTVTVTCSWSKVGLRPLGLIPSSKLVVGSVVMRKEGM